MEEKLNIRDLAIEQAEFEKKVLRWKDQVNFDQRLNNCKSEEEVHSVWNELVPPLFDDDGQGLEIPSHLFVDKAIHINRFWKDKKYEST